MGSIDGKSQGIMPANYLKIMGKKMGEDLTSQQIKPSKHTIKNLSMEKIFDETA